ncbi:glycosyltransferase [Acetobacteraceae bacterium]|nr:glycosyltransferase [Acetobacteraceae bacterium]
MSKVAIVLFVKNEITDISFWIAWHFHCGFDSLIIYDDYSTDGTWELLSEASQVLDIRLHRAVKADQFNHRQNFSYMNALEKYRKEFDWLLYLDSDEYLDIRNGENVHDFLERYPRANAIALSWCCYGSNCHAVRPPSSNVFRNYPMHSNQDFEYNYIVKSFIRPKETETKYINPHRFEVKGHYVTVDHKEIQWQKIHPECTETLAQWETARINHYVIRSMAHFVQKVERRVDIRESRSGMHLFNFYDQNHHYDTISASRYDGMMPYLYAIQNRVNQKYLSLMIATCGRGLNGEIKDWPTYLEMSFSTYTLRTAHGTSLFAHPKTGRIKHANTEEVAKENLVPVIALISSKWPEKVFLTTEKYDLPLFASEDPRVSTILSFQLVQHGKRFSLHNPITGLIACALNAEENGVNLEFSRWRVLEWELFEATPSSLKKLEALQMLPSLFSHFLDVSKLKMIDKKKTADLFTGIFQLLTPEQQNYWKARNQVPDYPWLHRTALLSV